MAEVFAYVGELEFFYEESPDALRSLCGALYLLSVSLVFYMSSFILTIVTYFTTMGDKVEWTPENLNEGQLVISFGFGHILAS